MITNQPLDSGWELARGPAGSVSAPSPRHALTWRPIGRRATVAQALLRLGDSIEGIDAEHWSFRTRFEPPPGAQAGELALRFDGLATLATVYLNGRLLIESRSMFMSHRAWVGDRLEATNELEIRIRPLDEAMEGRRSPRARWRTRVVEDGRLRWVRTTLTGRAPGFAPGPPVIGPWRPVVLERHAGAIVEAAHLRPRLAGDAGRLEADLRFRLPNLAGTQRVELRAEGPTGSHAVRLATSVEGEHLLASGALTIPGVARWWPHTHGVPHRYRVSARLGGAGTHAMAELDLGFTGFRRLVPAAEPGRDPNLEGLAIEVNGVPVFSRGALWIPPDLAQRAEPVERDSLLRLARDGGMNMLRIPGTSAYEVDAFHDLCDELGMMVWQDLMFANMDYPFADRAFEAEARAELAMVVNRLAPHPSTTVVCGGSEVEQQAAMLGLDPELGRAGFYTDDLPAAARAAGLDAAIVRSSPVGGALPFRADVGIAHYYGVGAYRRPLSDARAAAVRFAAECLAFANVPAEDGLVSADPPGSPAWKDGVPRDAGASWDFEDVRDHYLAERYRVDPDALRSEDGDRYLELSRIVSGEMMAAVIGEWRRAASTCRGALINAWNDLDPGCGWGVVDLHGRPKPAYHVLRRVLAPVAVWMTDEGLNGVVVHVANDTGRHVGTRLDLEVFRDREHVVGRASRDLELGPHAQMAFDAEGLLGRFIDIGWSYRFGPPGQDLVVATLRGMRHEAQVEPLSQAFHHPLGPPVERESPVAMGLQAEISASAEGGFVARIAARRLLHGARLDAPGFLASDELFSVAPGSVRTLHLRPAHAGAEWREGALRAVNLSAVVPLPSPAS